MSQPGTLAEEATRLLGAVEDWWRDRATGSPDAAGAEAFEHALDAAGSLVLALRSLLEARDRSWAAGHRAPVQHIPIREGDE
jgi:hypothetical protein